MKRAFKGGGVLLLLLSSLWPTALFGQINPYAPAPPVLDARARRMRREMAVMYVGPIARDFVEGPDGDDAVAAIAACSQPVAYKLCEFHASGGLDKLPRPRDFLRVIGAPNNGGDVALWGIQHANELEDVDNFDGFIQSPLEIALGLKPLSEGAAEAHAIRLGVHQAAAEAQPVWDARAIAVGVGALAIVMLLVWRVRMRRMQQTV